MENLPGYHEPGAATTAAAAAAPYAAQLNCATVFALAPGKNWNRPRAALERWMTRGKLNYAIAVGDSSEPYLAPERIAIALMSELAELTLSWILLELAVSWSLSISITWI